MKNALCAALALLATAQTPVNAEPRQWNVGLATTANQSPFVGVAIHKAVSNPCSLKRMALTLQAPPGHSPPNANFMSVQGWTNGITTEAIARC